MTVKSDAAGARRFYEFLKADARIRTADPFRLALTPSD